MKCPSPNAEYVYVTDDKTITSSTWNVVYVENEFPQDPFLLCYQIRFNPFNYVHTDIVLRIDGSMEINGDTDWLIDEFVKGGYDIALTPHPCRETCFEEYMAWVKTRGMSMEEANAGLKAVSDMGWNVNTDKGLYAFGFMIQRNNEVNNFINSETFNILRSCAVGDKLIHRCDQVIGSVVINLVECKPMMLRQATVFNKMIRMYKHGTKSPQTVSWNVYSPHFKKKSYPWAF